MTVTIPQEQIDAALLANREALTEMVQQSAAPVDAMIEENRRLLGKVVRAAKRPINSAVKDNMALLGYAMQPMVDSVDAAIAENAGMLATANMPTYPNQLPTLTPAAEPYPIPTAPAPSNGYTAPFAQYAYNPMQAPTDISLTAAQQPTAPTTTIPAQPSPVAPAAVTPVAQPASCACVEVRLPREVLALAACLCNFLNRFTNTLPAPTTQGEVKNDQEEMQGLCPAPGGEVKVFP